MPRAIADDCRYFDSADAAHRYAQGRPALHPLVIEHIQREIPLTWPVGRALDVACGTGLSTVALLPIACEVIGADISEEMLRMAAPSPQIEYVVADAHHLPFPDGHFDLVTLCSALHWLDARAFFREAHRVLRTGGGMVVYDVAFTGRMEGEPGFHSWMRRIFLATYPMQHQPRVPMPGTAQEAGFHSLGKEEYRHTVRLSLSRLVDYQVSRSNVTVAVEGGGQTLEQVRAWLTERAARFFGPDQEKPFIFGGPIWYLVRP